MKPQVDAAELAERIRREARRHRAKAFPSSVDAESAGFDHNGAFLAAPPVLAFTEPGGFSCEGLLAQAKSMLERARGKTVVGKGVPKILRPLFRNQGGYNDIVLESLERLREVSRSLAVENAQLRLHIQRQTEWMDAVVQRFAQVETRLDSVDGQSPDCAESAADAQGDSEVA